MLHAPLDTVVRHLRGFPVTPATADLSDAQLLQRFVDGRDEAAFAGLVDRHGRLIRTVCRNVLRIEEDVEDALQATLLVLARKAASIRKGTSLASWLYGVAYRTAMNARKMAVRRMARERQSESR